MNPELIKVHAFCRPKAAVSYLFCNATVSSSFCRPSPTSSSRSSPTRRTPPWPSRILALAWQRTNWSTTWAPSQSQELRRSWKRWPREVTLAWLVSSASASTAPTWSRTRFLFSFCPNPCFDLWETSLKIFEVIEREPRALLLCKGFRCVRFEWSANTTTTNSTFGKLTCS